MKPILFNTDMVRAILEGRKTVTRRIVKPQPPNTGMYFDGLMPLNQAPKEGNAVFRREQNDGFCVWKPPYQIGDTIYVRETWNKYEKRVGKGEGCHIEQFYGYKASPTCSEVYNQPWKPSIHMPKEVARIFLKVTDIRAEKLQNLTIQQAKKEGAFHACSMCYYWHDHCGQAVTMAKDCKIDRISPEFPKLWDSTIKKQDLDRFDWEANPWVWVIEFERCEIMKEESDIADFEQRELIDDK